jgi:hypothetical protein
MTTPSTTPAITMAICWSADDAEERRATHNDYTDDGVDLDPALPSLFCR